MVCRQPRERRLQRATAEGTRPALKQTVQFKALTETDRPWRAVQDRRHVGTGLEVAGERHSFGSVLFLYISPDTAVAEGVELTPTPN